MIFNTEKTAEAYGNVSLFANGEIGLLDTVNKKFTDIWDLYKEMKSLDWDELEFDYSQCLTDFEKAPADVCEAMIKTIMWQWEADSIASQAPCVIIAPYEPCTELWEAELRINDNESVHGNTYSEIVRMGFPLPQNVLSSMLEKTETYRRLSIVGRELKRLKKKSVQLAYDKEFRGKVVTEDDVVEDMLLFYYILWCLERVQFPNSFAVTFTICQSGWFQPIGQAVKKICQDELEVHCEYRKAVVDHLLKTEKGKAFFDSNKDLFVSLLEEVVDAEARWVVEDLLDHDNRVIVGTNTKLLTQFGLFNAKAIASHLGLKTKYSFPKTNPMPHLDNWMNMNKNQSAPQEQDNPAYKINVVVDNDLEFNYKF